MTWNQKANISNVNFLISKIEKSEYENQGLLQYKSWQTQDWTLMLIEQLYTEQWKWNGTHQLHSSYTITHCFL
jgi:hypothetical protein